MRVCRGVLAQRMLEGGTEFAVGLSRDPQSGPVVMVGLGGVLVEALGDVAFRAAPLTREDAGAMLGELRGTRVLEGTRGRPPADVPAVIDVLLAVSRLAVEAGGEVAELDDLQRFKNLEEARRIIGSSSSGATPSGSSNGLSTGRASRPASTPGGPQHEDPAGAAEIGGPHLPQDRV